MRTYDYSTVPLNGKDVPVLIPYYSADRQNALERGERPYTVIEILREVFKEDFRKAIEFYLDRYPKDTARAIKEKEAEKFKLIWLSEPHVESSLRQAVSTKAIDLVFRAVVEAEVDFVPKRFNVNYRLRYLLDLRKRQCSAPMVAPAEFFPRDMITEQKTAITNQYLLPIMHTKDYPAAARRLLEMYYREALEAAVPVNGYVLAERMGLKVRRVRYEKERDIQGRIYFDWTEVRLRDADGMIKTEKIPPMTILINIDLCPTPEIENSTVVHECCHVYLDLTFFMLQMLSGKAYRTYTSRKRKRLYTRSNGPIDWMELQAEKLPAYILMEENNTKKEIERLLELRGGIRSPEIIFWIVCRLASVFKVSRSMAKYRMIELGYPEAEGVYTFHGRTRIPDHGCAGTWEQGVTYTITLADAGSLLGESKAFAKALGSGQYTYVEGHYCLDTETYVERRYNRTKRLTSYARHHIDECCISFSVGGRYANTSYEDAQAARKTEVTDKYQSRHKMESEPDSKERVRENTLFSLDSEIWMKLMMEMPDHIGKAVQLILDRKGISQNELAMRLGVSRAALRKWCTSKMSLRHVIAICLALDVRADIGQELVRMAGHSFRNTRECNLFKAMLYEPGLSVARGNEIMRQEKLAPLTEGMDEALAG